MFNKINRIANRNQILLVVCSILLLITVAMVDGYGIAFISLPLIIVLLFLFHKPGLVFKGATYLALLYPIITTSFIIVILALKAISFFSEVPMWQFLLGTKWSPHGTISEHGIFQKIFGLLPLISGTLMVTAVATIVAVPLGVLSAIHISYFAKKNRNISKTIVEILAGIPSVVYGYFAFSMMSPFISSVGKRIGIDIALESSMSAGIVMGIMIMPIVISTVDDVLDAVPKNLYYGALVLGSTKSEAITKVVLPVAMPGILSAILLAITRAIGETVIVLMATGVGSRLTLNPFEPISTINVQIATIITGDQCSESIETLSAYTLGLILFFITWVMNAISLAVVSRQQVIKL